MFRPRKYLLYPQGLPDRGAKLEEVLHKFPVSMEASKARYELADSYRLLADQQERLLNDGTTYRPARRDHWTETCQRWRTRAVEEFEALVATVEKPESASHLDSVQRRDVYLYAALTQWNMGNYEKALAAYDRMAQRAITVSRTIGRRSPARSVPTPASTMRQKSAKASK